MDRPFQPVPASTVNIDVSASSQRVLLGSVDRVRVMNNGTATIWQTFGDATVTASVSTGLPVGPGGVEVFTLPQGATYVAAIAAGSTGKVYYTPGEGY